MGADGLFEGKRYWRHPGTLTMPNPAQVLHTFLGRNVRLCAPGHPREAFWVNGG